MAGKVRLLRVLSRGFIVLLLIMVWLWGTTAILLAGPEPHWLQVLIACIFGLLLPTAFIFTRSFMRGCLVCLCLFVILIMWWQTLTPTNDKDWAPAVANMSHGEIRGETLIMKNVRNFDYQSEQLFDQQWDTRTYDLNNLQGIDLFLSYWASEHIAHTILSWDFGADGHLAISIETRKDKTQQYSAIKGFFKQFEIAYIAADERDIIRLRTNIWKERVYRYRLQAPKQRIRVLLENYLDEMNSLVKKPEFYNALTHNCTTTIQVHANATRSDAPPPLDWRIIATGHVDELLYDRGVIRQDVPFAELRKASRIDKKMQEYDGPDFSGALREVSR